MLAPIVHEQSVGGPAGIRWGWWVGAGLIERSDTPGPRVSSGDVGGPVELYAGRPNRALLATVTPR